MQKKTELSYTFTHEETEVFIRKYLKEALGEDVPKKSNIHFYINPDVNLVIKVNTPTQE